MALHTGNPYLDAIGGTPWNRDQNHTGFDGALLLSVYFDNNFDDRFAAGAWTGGEISAFWDALHTWSAVANVRFNQASNPNAADLFERKVTVAFFDDPATNASHSNFDSGPADGGPLFGYFNVDSFWTPGAMQVGGYTFETLVHELGHALGLEHTHTTEGGTGRFPGIEAIDGMGNGSPTDSGDNDLNKSIYSIMSYNDGRGPSDANSSFGWVATPMAFDIAAVQTFYGAVAANTGNTVYTLGDTNAPGAAWRCIWDTGGDDTIAYDGKGEATIDLRPASLANGEGGGGFKSFVQHRSGSLTLTIAGGFTIAADATGFIPDRNGVWGVIIENARGGSGNDTLYGNDVDNMLQGGNGNDHMNGFGGNDTMIGGRGDDVYVVDSQSDQVLEISGAVNGLDKIYTSLRTYSMNVAGHGTAVEDLQFVGTGRFNGTGNALGNAIVGAKGADTLHGLGGNDWLVGNEGTDTLYGESGNDHLDGGAGADTMRGGNDNDTYVVNHRGDVVIEQRGTLVSAGGLLLFSGGIDTVETTLDSYALPDWVENLRFTGSGPFFGVGNELDNTIIGGSDDDILRGLGGADHLVGGGGNDIAEYIGTLRGLTVDLGDPSQNSGEARGDTYDSIEGLRGTRHADVLRGDGGANYIDGRGGADLIHGRAGEDWLVGGAGNDRLYGGADADRLDGGAGIDTANYSDSSAAVTVDLATGHGSGGDADGDQLISIENLVGSAFDDTLTGDGGSNRIEGGEGRNHLYGGGGADTLIGGTTYDWMEGGEGDDTLTGTGGQTVMFGGGGNDTMTGSLDNTNYFDGGLGDDVMIGGNTTDYLSDVEGGRDTMYGGGGDDTLVDYYDPSFLYGEAGNDFMSATGSGSTLDGGADNDTMTVANGDYTVIGGTGEDRLEAAGYGNVVFTGGADADIFAYRVQSSGPLTYTVTDFEDGTDRILLWDFAFNGNVPLSSLLIVDSAAGAVISWNGLTEMTLVGIAASQLTAADFLISLP
ncbi:MAG: matrixin family metalloprotease [Hyphomicrobiaceae bacterium]